MARILVVAARGGARTERAGEIPMLPALAGAGIPCYGWLTACRASSSAQTAFPASIPSSAGFEDRAWI